MFASALVAPPALRDSAPSGNRPKLLDRLREALRSRHYSRRTEDTCSHWGRRYCHFHALRHPNEMGEAEIDAFVTHLAVKERVGAEVSMPIRIRRRAKRQREAQALENPVLTGYSFAERTASYADRKEGTRILCGSI